VYEWAAVAASSGAELPQPKWKFNTASAGPTGETQGHIYDVVEEHDGGGLIFGGIGGKVWRMDLKTGSVSELVEMPDHAWVTSLALSSNGKVLGTASKSEQTRNAVRETKGIVRIWNYPRLCSASD
jgi:hypothetical protein